MNWWKHDYGYLLIKILRIIILLSCGNAFALPQDWSCKPIIVKKIAENKIDKTTTQYQYSGTSDLYQLDIGINYIKDNPTYLDDCGTLGCTGLIKNVQTSETEYLNFYCKPIINENLDTLTCTIHHDLEYLFNKKSDAIYISQLCIDKPRSFYRLNLRNCNKCKCDINYYEHNKKQYSTTLNCMKNNNETIKCFTAEGYILKHKLKNTLEDYDNCIGLEL